MAFHDVPQNTPEWDALRLGRVTNSNAPTFMANEGRAFGEPAQRYALQVALELETGRKAEHSFSNTHTERGHAQEPVARMLYEAEHFCKVGNGGFFDWGAYGDSPDFLVGERGVGEIKSVIAPTHYATWLRGSYDPAYKWQLIGHLDCTGREWCDFISYCSDFPLDRQLLVYRLERRFFSEEIARLRRRRAEFIELVRSVRASLHGDTGPDRAATAATVRPVVAVASTAAALPASIFV